MGEKMPVLKGHRATLLYEGTEVGYVEDIRIEIDPSVEYYFPAMSREAPVEVEGPLMITGRFRRAWINVDYLSLLSTSSSLNVFELKLYCDNFGIIVKNCKLKKGTITIPQDGFIREDYDFVATHCIPYDLHGNLLKNGDFDSGTEGWTLSGDVYWSTAVGRDGTPGLSFGHGEGTIVQDILALRGYGIPTNKVTKFSLDNKNAVGIMYFYLTIFYSDGTDSGEVQVDSVDTWATRDLKPYLELNKEIVKIKLRVRPHIGEYPRAYLDNFVLSCD